jgi:hypothetical protein
VNHVKDETGSANTVPPKPKIRHHLHSHSSKLHHLPINMSIVSIVRFIFNVRRINGNLSCLFFWTLVNFFVTHGPTTSIFRKHLGNGLSQGRLSVIHVTDGANVHMRLVTVECCGKRSRCGQTNLRRRNHSVRGSQKESC